MRRGECRHDGAHPLCRPLGQDHRRSGESCTNRRLRASLDDAFHRQVKLEVFIPGLHALQASVPRRLAGGILAVIGLDVVNSVRTRGRICLQLGAEIVRFLHIGVDVAPEPLDGEILMLVVGAAGIPPRSGAGLRRALGVVSLVRSAAQQGRLPASEPGHAHQFLPLL